LNKYVSMGPSWDRCQMWACRLIASSKLLILLRLLLRRFPRGGWVEYLLRSPASRRRRWKVKSRSERVKYDQGSSAARTALAKASSICTQQTRPLRWGLRPDFYYCQTVTGLSMWGALSDERTGLCYIAAAGTTQKTSVTCQTASSLVHYQRCEWRGCQRKHSLLYCCVP
jgi:hypothetical protein